MSQDGLSRLIDRLSPAQPRLPLWLKLGYTGFLAVLVPIYWRDYGPSNFLYFCDVALFFTLAALWFESSLLASTALVGIFLTQTLWVVDFFFELAGGHLTELTHYMFEPQRPIFTRMLSFFHFWLPFLLLAIVWRLGYDRKAYAFWTVLAWAIMGVCFVAMPKPTATPENPNQPININYVYGFNSAKEQELLPRDWYYTVLCIALPLANLPSHLLLYWLFAKKPAGPAGAWAAST